MTNKNKNLASVLALRDRIEADWELENGTEENEDTETGRFCKDCEADILGNDPHAPGCPSDPSDGPGDESTDLVAL